MLGPILLQFLVLRSSSAHRVWDSDGRDRRCCGRVSDDLGLNLTPLVVDVLTLEVLSSKIGFDPVRCAFEGNFLTDGRLLEDV